jgi:hypothetical protein
MPDIARDNITLLSRLWHLAVHATKVHLFSLCVHGCYARRNQTNVELKSTLQLDGHGLHARGIFLVIIYMA